LERKLYVATNKVLEALGGTAMTALENARLFHEELEKKRLEDELNLARTIQKGLLPQELPPIDGGDMLFEPEQKPQETPPNSDENDAVKHLATEFARAISDISASTKAMADRENKPTIVNVDVASPSVTVEGAKLDIHNHIPRKPLIKRDAVVADDGRMIGMIESEIEDQET
jgi:hypothetical protein